MKLTTPQIETIELYLLAWGLEFKDFCDEVLDHFVTRMENTLENHESFEEAFTEVKKDFAGRIFKGYRGLKAFEMEYAESIKKELKKRLLQKVAEQFTTFRMLFWLLASFLVYQFYQSSNEVFLWPLMATFLVFYIAPIFLIGFNDLFKRRSRWLATEHSELEERKRSLLFQRTQQRVLAQTALGFFIIFNLLFQSWNILSNGQSIVLNILVLGVAMLGFSVTWAQFEIAVEEYNKSKFISWK